MKPQIHTLGELKQSGYKPKTIKQELRDNLIKRMKSGKPVFEGIYGYEDTVIPDLERALLSRHNMILLGLRGQAKTRIARLLVNLLDEYIPLVAGSELNDDPMAPVSKFAKDLIRIKGDETPVEWLAREDRYTEKLATPDVSVADLIGDLDPIKAANEKLAYTDERVIHYGLIPRSNRCIFVINELPDLQPRIQVSLFNILQEEDIQIRGFKLQLPLDIEFVFTANPEDYTNRGSIVTPLKDRIESQILTHYPKSIDVSMKITEQESRILEEQKERVVIHPLLKELIEQIAVEARNSEFVDPKSGVSARLTISAMENLIAAAERRAILNNENQTLIRIGDLQGVVPAITGKIELVYEGEQEGSGQVARQIIRKAIRNLFLRSFPDPASFKGKKKIQSPYTNIIGWFTEGNSLEILLDESEKFYINSLDSVKGIKELHYLYRGPGDKHSPLISEFILHGLAECSLIGKEVMEKNITFNDLFNSVFNPGAYDENSDN